MAGIFEKVGLLISANMHDLVNQALRANSVAVLDEQIRRAHESLEQLEDTMATVMGDRRIEARKNEDLKVAIAKLVADAKTLIQAGKDAQAAVMLKQKQLKEAALAKSDENLVSTNGDLDKLSQAKATLEMKIAELQTTRDNVDQALKIAKTKGRIVKTLGDLTDVLEESGAEGMADWAESVKAKADVKLEMTLEKHGALLDPLADGSVAAELARMKAEMAGETSDVAAAAGSATFEVTVEKK